MASYTFSERDGEDGGDMAGPMPPIASHPAFPAIVATWFAVLLGLGTLVIPAVLLERLVQASGIAALVPAAGPPLGITARALCAGAAAAVGVLLGLALAWRVVGSHRAVAGTLASEAPRPFALSHEIGEPGVGSQGDFLEMPPAESEERAPAETAFAHEGQGVGMREEAEKAIPPPARSNDPLESLGLEQLVERLRYAIEGRRAGQPEAARMAPSARPRGTPAFDSPVPEDTTQAAAAYFARPIDFQTAPAAAEVPSEPWEDEGASGDDAGYGSLLSLGNPLAYRDSGHTSAREERPAAPIPPAAELSASPDAALRAALARLQRLSGAA